MRRESPGLAASLVAFSKSYVLSALGAPVLKITLQPPMDGALQPGSTFCGLLDFRLHSGDTSSTSSSSSPKLSPRCHEVSVMLESEEVVAPYHSSRGVNGSKPGQGRVVRALHCEHQEVTTDVAASSFVFTVPGSAVPSFKTPMVSLRWVLRFELSVGAPIDCSSIAGGALQGGRPTPQLQQVTWTLPLFILPPLSRGERP